VVEKTAIWGTLASAAFVSANSRTKASFPALRNLLGNLENMTDPISDLIIRIQNASKAGKESVLVLDSNVAFAVLEKLFSRGYVKKPVRKVKDGKKMIEVELLYKEDKSPRISGVRRYSKLSKRLYRGFREIHRVRQGFGSMIVSTPKGILADDEARKEKVGGEILFSIW
jgi:small subunit ribosomal protein S8